MKRKGLTILLAVVFMTAVLLLFPMRNDRDYSFTASWPEDVPTQFVFPGSRPKIRGIPFRSADMFGYISRDGTVLYAEPVVYDSTASADFFINYSSVSENLIVKNRYGDIVASIATTGYPLILEDRLFVIDRDRCGISEYDFDGGILWKRRYSTLITALDCNKNQVLIGLVNGELCICDPRQRDPYRDKPSGSRIQAIYGCAISETGEYFAAIVGADPQRLILYRLNDEGYVPVYSVDLTDSIRSELFLQFSKGGRYLFYEQNGGLGRYDLKRRETDHFPLKGTPIDLHQSSHIGGLYIHSASPKAESVDIFSNGGEPIRRFAVDPHTTVTFEEAAIFLQSNKKIRRIDIIGETNETSSE